MGSVSEEQERVKNLLLDTVTLLCKNGLSFKKQLKVQGLLGITMDEDNVFIVHINEKVGDVTIEHQKQDNKKQNNVCSDNSGSKDSNTHAASPEKLRSRKRSSTSSPIYKGPPEKVKIKTEQFDEDLVLLEETKANIPKISAIQGTNFNPNSTGDMNEFGQYNPGLSNQYTGMPSAFVTGVVPNTSQLSDTSQAAGGQTDKVRYIFERSTRTRRSSYATSEKKFVCDVEGCSRRYYERRHMLEHQYLKHGRPRPSRKAPGVFHIAMPKQDPLAVPGETIVHPELLQHGSIDTNETVQNFEDKLRNKVSATSRDSPESSSYIVLKNESEPETEIEVLKIEDTDDSGEDKYACKRKSVIPKLEID